TVDANEDAFMCGDEMISAVRVSSDKVIQDDTQVDHLSALHDDGLLAILSYVDRDSLDAVERTSRRNNYIASFFCSVQRRKRALVVSQTATGYVFALLPFNADLHPSWCYYISLDEQRTGKYNEKAVKRRRMEPCEYPVQGCDNIREESIPSLLCDRVEITLRKNAVDEIVFSLLCFTPDNLPPLTEKLERSLVSAIKIDKIRVSEDFTIDNWRSFATWMLKIKPKQICISHCPIDKSTVIDQKFLEDFTSDRNGVKLIVRTDADDIELPRFYPTVEILETIPRFDKLRLASMVLQPEWVVELLLEQLDKPDDGVERDWDFTLASPIEEYHMAGSRFRYPSLECIIVEKGGKIKRTDNKNCVYFRVDYQERSDTLLLKAGFYMNQKA
ncbi:hypothetical protein PFISCL1PPCAC_3171, partial [Pristionchus fissidentatus]